jgi:hypothetical protein
METKRNDRIHSSISKWGKCTILKKTSPNMSFKFSLISLAKKKFFKIEIVEVLLAVYHVTRKT